jgi:hypothetical protein
VPLKPQTALHNYHINLKPCRAFRFPPVLCCRAEQGGLDGVWVNCLGGAMPTVRGTGSQRLKEVTIHTGPVTGIAIHAGELLQCLALVGH